MIATKTCSQCKKLLPVSSFYKSDKGRCRSDCTECSAKRNKKYYLENKNKIAATNKKWTQENKEKIQNAKAQKKFGISLKEKNQLFKAQGSACAICKSTKNTTPRDWDVDHCHVTGKIRGILCSNCNRGLGLFQDNQQNLLRAAKYLDEHRQ